VAEGEIESTQSDVLPEEPAERVRGLLERIVEELGLAASVSVEEEDEEIHADIEGEDVGLLIGRHGQTIDAIQYLANAAMYRGRPEDRKEVVVDAAGYRARRRTSLEALAIRSAERAVAGAEPVELEPMTAIERKVVHLRLKEFDGVETTSEGTEPNRFVVIHPVS
jgi:spoIIIJ-associated protein